MGHIGLSTGVTQGRSPRTHRDAVPMKNVSATLTATSLTPLEHLLERG